MNFRGIDICCPRCHGDLAWGSDARDRLVCQAGAHAFPVVDDIPDLRVFDDPYISAEDDRAKGQGIARQLDSRTFDELIDYYYANTSVVPPQHARLYKAGLLGAEARARATLEGWNAEPGGCLLEIGCGTGPLLVAAHDRFQRMVGVDIAFRWLQVGRKRLDEAGVDVPLICACAEALPFPPASFDAVAMDSTLELVHDQPATLRECARTIKPAGQLLVATPNKFSLGPDPHTGLLAGSMLPEGVVAWYMKKKNAVPPVRRLLSAGSVRRLLSASGFENVSVTLPSFPREQVKYLAAPIRAAVGMYDLVRKTPGVRAVLKTIGPRLLVTARHATR